MGDTSVRRSPAFSPPRNRAQAPLGLRAGDPPDLIVQRREIQAAPEVRIDRRQPRSRVVIADLHAVTRHGMRALCDLCGTVEVVAEASSTGDLVRAATACEADLVVLGFDPPDHVVIARLLQEAPETRVLVMSPSNDEQDITRAFSAGAAGYVSKSVTPGEFRAAIETVKAGGTYLDGPAADALRFALGRTASRRPKRADIGDLTEREMEIARLMSEGLTARRIGSRLGISDRTVSTHIGSLYRRLGVNNRVDAVRELMRRGIASTPR